MKYARRVDANQKAIAEALRAAGVSVIDLPNGDGIPDLLCGFRGLNILLEVKNPTTRYGQGRNDNAAGTTARQEQWRDTWRGQVAVVWSVEEAFEVLGLARAT
jgi:hypothetical protein